MVIIDLGTRGLCNIAAGFAWKMAAIQPEKKPLRCGNRFAPPTQMRTYKLQECRPEVHYQRRTILHSTALQW